MNEIQTTTRRARLYATIGAIVTSMFFAAALAALRFTDWRPYAGLTAFSFALWPLWYWTLRIPAKSKYRHVTTKTQVALSTIVIIGGVIEVISGGSSWNSALAGLGLVLFGVISLWEDLRKGSNRTDDANKLSGK